MSLFDFFTVIRPNPDLLGQIRVTREDIDPASIEAYEQKLRRARQYLTENNIRLRPICRTLPAKT